MALPARYLEAARRDEVARDLSAQGYRVLTDDPRPYDIVAVGPRGERIAVEIEAVPQPAERAEEVADLQRRAFTEGYDEFRLLLVGQPREREIEIEGFEEALRGYVMGAMATPPEIGALAQNSRIADITDVEIDAVQVELGGLTVAGRGTVEVALEWGGGEANDGVGWKEYLPFRFSAVLDRALRIEEVEFRADVSSFTERTEDAVPWPDVRDGGSIRYPYTDG